MTERVEQVERGVERLRDLPEVMPDDAGPAVAEVYEDVRGTLRVPFVNFLFRAVANWPATLEAGWRGVRPAARSRQFEDAADRLRRKAAGLLPEGRETETPALEQPEATERIRALTTSIHYVLPKLLLVAAAWQESLAHPTEEPAGVSTGWPPEELPYGPAAGMVKVEMVAPKTASGAVAELFTRIREAHGHPGVASYYRSLANWPSFLEALWERLEPEVRQQAYRERSRRLAEAASEALPALGLGRTIPSFPAESEVSRQELGDVLAVFRHRLVPDLLQDVSRITTWL